jgi:hypothetical protein
MASPLDVTPSASRLAGSLRDIGYDLNTALADLVDNSISADAVQIDVIVVFQGLESYIVVADDGWGMTHGELAEAMRFGSRREYGERELGRFGLGLKTASISQGRRLTVATRRAQQRRWISALELDLDELERTDRWQVQEPQRDAAMDIAGEWLDGRPGTVVVIDKLDRVLPERNPEGGWARRRLNTLAGRAAGYLGMVFHRFIEGEFGLPITITVNGAKVIPWNPFAPDEEYTQPLPIKEFEIDEGECRGSFLLRPYVLPPRRQFSSMEEFERLSGMQKWNRQQGFYVYRAGRMIQSGGWSGLRAADEHTKLARVALDFDPELDEVFRVDVAKMRTALPAQARTLLERPVQEVCHRANAAYRKEAARNGAGQDRPPPSANTDEALRAVGGALIAAGAKTGDFDALTRVLAQLREDQPELAQALGW